MGVKIKTFSGVSATSPSGVKYTRLFQEVQENVHRDDDDFYEDLINRLYKPAKKKKVGEVITQAELEFEVEPAPEVEPAEKPEPAVPEGDCESTTTETDSDTTSDEDVWNTDDEAPIAPTMVSKWKKWLNDLMKDVTE